MADFQSNLESYIKYGYNVPFLVGEFHLHSKTDFRNGVALMANRKIGWADWTYKGVDVGNWAYRIYGKEFSVDLENDSFDRIMNIWKSMGNFRNSNPNYDKVFN